MSDAPDISDEEVDAAGKLLLAAAAAYEARRAEWGVIYAAMKSANEGLLEPRHVTEIEEMRSVYLMDAENEFMSAWHDYRRCAE